MKQTLQLKLSQHLALTPQLQQSIRLLQLSTLELNQEIEQFLQENPLLERVEPGDDGAAFAPPADLLTQTTTPEAPPERDDTPPGPEGDEPGWGSELPMGHGNNRDPDDDSDAGDIQAAATSLRDHLLTQMALTQVSARERALVAFLVEALDEDGYLTQSLEDLLDLLPEDFGGDREEQLEELQIALRHLQHFDPAGIGARNPRECLELQLLARPDCPAKELARTLVRDHLDQLAARDFIRIKKALNCSDDELRDAQALILTLNPRPGAQYAALDTRYIVPDVVVRKLRGQWLASLNGEAMPRLRINRLYANILRQNRGSSLAGHLQEAKWLIKNVQQRFDTILRVTQAIVDRQRAFFDHGEVAMRPLTLREIADTVGLHESTISRVTTQKYLASPRGIFELKYFFGSHVATDSGGAASSTAIRALIKQLVGAENGKKPLSDSRLAEILGEQGIVVARRTVAKYRESLNIPPVNLRKTL
ncbi:RNA polymerase factor sigma-54 [Denitratisoma oestradiolicum]|uniref:RNA polymerase sigma-54 factor n=1 Tax=Denitratisoma oestradiolicum TaxID=311182 RepID=A0A6S6Y0W3_9PROT|nr:RNA polymerase factor sigma-54 [Denitratisoma oestradiolicum]TWO80749.1 RNA polymerase factor sigma-54 [Denitratisoma oestradiolicum]CAB1370943.1 RNA polymerase, sigma 54 (sigma N) factor [Denitratisoma oestradiolicum]